jgi:V/A-type H+/Na+-transporting ATPase subunit D
VSAPGGVRVPSGRAGRLWLRGRLQIANRGMDLLDRKLRILRGEHERLALLAQRTGHDWELACQQAATWLLRAALLGGQRALRLSADGPAVEVSVVWRDTMGLHYPAEATCEFAEEAPPPLGNAALDRARTAHRAALAAAVKHAAVTAALESLANEIATTTQRLRAIQDRWIPRLRDALAELELALDESEQADAARLRRAAAMQGHAIGRLR